MGSLECELGSIRDDASKEALSLRHLYLGPEHLFLSSLRHEIAPAIIADRFHGFGITYVSSRVHVTSGDEEVSTEIAAQKLPQTPRMKQTLESAVQVARLRKTDRITREHLLLGILRNPECFVYEIIRRHHADPERVRIAIRESMSEQLMSAALSGVRG